MGTQGPETLPPHEDIYVTAGTSEISMNQLIGWDLNTWHRYLHSGTSTVSSSESLEHRGCGFVVTVLGSAPRACCMWSLCVLRAQATPASVSILLPSSNSSASALRQCWPQISVGTQSPSLETSIVFRPFPHIKSEFASRLTRRPLIAHGEENV